jgi:hypothetical protein
VADGEVMRRSEFTKASLAVAAGCWLAFLTGPNAMVAGTNSSFLNVLPEALNTTRTSVSGSLGISVWIVGLVMPLILPCTLTLSLICLVLLGRFRFAPRK